ncbi:MAG TPA: antitoxin [Acidimicrobiia bacterium]|nr:antitoxin [Acidimicrobiia bacterium]
MPGFLDKAKKKLGDVGEKAKDLAADNREKIEAAVDKTTTFVDKKTKGKHHDKLEKVADKTRAQLDKLDDDEPETPGAANDAPSADTTPPADESR